MRPKKHGTTGSGDLFRARLEQIINTKHELVQLAGKIDWEWIDGEIAPLYSEQRPARDRDPFRDRLVAAQAA
jgi:IS5 family transposase